MSNRIIPRETLGEYRRWELESLDALSVPEPLPEPEPELEPEPEATVVEEEIPHFNWPTAEEIEEIQQRAHDEGLQAGHQEGLAAGRAEGLAAGHQEGLQAGLAEGRQQSFTELERIKQVGNALDAALVEFEAQMGQEVLGLALALARQILRNAIHFRPDAVLTIVRDALASLPQAGQHPQLILHPEDAQLVRSLMENELAHLHCRIVEDAQIERGGCRIRTDASEVDATLAGRWEKAVATLARDDSWLA